MFRNHRTPFFPPSNINLLSALVARVIAEMVTLGQTFGYRFPKEYDVGFKLVEDAAMDGGATMTIRIWSDEADLSRPMAWSRFGLACVPPAPCLRSRSSMGG
jgi:hypothetical protein